MDGHEHRTFILVASLAPLFGVLAAIALLWDRGVTASDMVCLVMMYTIGALGISVGFHRLLAHRAFKCSRPVYLALAAAGTLAGQGPPIIWTAHHRRHHRVADKEGDPHSPYLNDEPGRIALIKGLWHAHLGWLFDTNLTSDPMRYCPDLARDRGLRWISRHFIAIVVLGVLAPGVLGFALAGTWQGALTGVLWGGLVRLFLLNHITYAVNSIGHVYGRRRFSTSDESRNVGWLAIPSFGEAWHNNHHAFPRAASHGMRWYEVDLSALFIRGLAAVGLASDVVHIDGPRQAAKIESLNRAGTGRFAPSSPPEPMAQRKDRGFALASLTDVE